MNRPSAPGRAHRRVARPTDDLTAVVHFYRDGLGFAVLAEFRDHDGFDGVMLGHRGGRRRMATIQVRVKPNARVRSLAEADGGWVARVAKQFGVAKAAVTIRSGAGGRLKLVQIADG